MIIQDDEKTYHGNPALSNSKITRLLKCPALLTYEPQEKEDTDSLLLGRLFHALVLEPETVSGKYVEKKYNGTTKEGRAEKAQAEANGLTLVKSEIWNTALSMASVVKNNPSWQQLESQGPIQPETSFYWTQDNLECKARLDAIAYVNGKICVADLKTTTDASPSAIQKSIVKYGYHRQAVWYKHALTMHDMHADMFVFFFVEKYPPYIVTPVVLDDVAEGIAYDELQSAIKIYKECNQTGVWPQYTNEILILSLPEYYAQKGE